MALLYESSLFNSYDTYIGQVNENPDYFSITIESIEDQEYILESMHKLDMIDILKKKNMYLTESSTANEDIPDIDDDKLEELEESESGGFFAKIKGFFIKIWTKIKNFFAAIGRFFKRLFSRKKTFTSSEAKKIDKVIEEHKEEIKEKEIEIPVKDDPDVSNATTKEEIQKKIEEKKEEHEEKPKKVLHDIVETFDYKCIGDTRNNFKDGESYIRTSIVELTNTQMNLMNNKMYTANHEKILSRQYDVNSVKDEFKKNLYEKFSGSKANNVDEYKVNLFKLFRNGGSVKLVELDAASLLFSIESLKQLTVRGFHFENDIDGILKKLLSELDNIKKSNKDNKAINAGINILNRLNTEASQCIQIFATEYRNAVNEGINKYESLLTIAKNIAATYNKDIKEDNSLSEPEKS